MAAAEYDQTAHLPRRPNANDNDAVDESIIDCGCVLTPRANEKDLGILGFIFILAGIIWLFTVIYTG
jgi:hypothetical protein